MPDLPEGYSIRSATSADGEPVRRLVNAILQEYGINPDPEHADKGLKDIDASFTNGRLDLLFNEADRLTGTVGVLQIDNSVCELTKMFLDKCERGQGLGRLLLERALGFARQNGYQTMQLETDTKLIEAIALYKRYGFVENEAESDATKRCNTVMRLTL